MVKTGLQLSTIRFTEKCTDWLKYIDPCVKNIYNKWMENKQKHKTKSWRMKYWVSWHQVLSQQSRIQVWNRLCNLFKYTSFLSFTSSQPIFKSQFGKKFPTRDMRSVVFFSFIFMLNSWRFSRSHSFCRNKFAWCYHQNNL